MEQKVYFDCYCTAVWACSPAGRARVHVTVMDRLILSSVDKLTVSVVAFCCG